MANMRGVEIVMRMLVLGWMDGSGGGFCVSTEYVESVMEVGWAGE